MVQKKLPMINSAHGSDTRNIINELIKLFNGMGYTYDEALQKAHDTLNEAQRTNRLNNDTNARLDKIIADSGTSSTEVVDARGEHTLLGARLNAEFSKNNTLQSEFIKDLAIINPQHLSKWRNKRARMLDENVKAKIAFWGDSITEGYYATYPLTLEAKRTKTFVGLLNQYYKNNVGDVGIGYAQTMVSGTTDSLSEWTWDSGFTIRQDTYTKGSIRSATIGSTATLPFNGTGIDIALIKARFYGNANIYIDNNLIVTVNLESATTTNELHIESIRGLTDSNHVLKIEHSSGSYLSVIGALPIKGDKGVVTLNFSRSGDRTDRLTEISSIVPESTKKSLGLFNPDVVCICYHTNDAGHNTGISEYISRLSYFVDKALENGSEVILIAQSIQTGMNNQSKNVIYRNAMRSVADEKGVCMIDYTGRFLYGDEVEGVNKFLYDSDHYNEIGHNDMFEILIRTLEN